MTNAAELRRALGVAAVAMIVAGLLSACGNSHAAGTTRSSSPTTTTTRAGAGGPLATPGDTSHIQLVSHTTAGGWEDDYYVNRAYPCAISGFQTFTIEYRTGTNPTTPAPLWVHMHGGGIGVWSTDSSGKPVFLPNDMFTSQESATEIGQRNGTGGLSELIRNDPAGFRIVSVSYCGRDVYGGTGAADPGNPNTWVTPAGKAEPRTTNGLLATKAAIQYAMAKFTTTKFFLQGTSAGSAGAYAVSWALQQQGIPPAGTVADSGMANPAADAAKKQQNFSCATKNKPGIQGAIQKRVDPVLAAPNNSPDQLVASGRLTVPIAQIWDQADPTECGNTPMTCPLQHMPPGSPATQQMGAADCTNQALHQAIVDEGAKSTSISLGVCVDPKAPTTPKAGVCNRHVVTTIDAVSSIGTANYNQALLDWVHARLAVHGA